MTPKLNRREMLKMMAAGSAAIAGASLPSLTPIVHAQSSVREIKFWQPPIWRYGADNKTVTGRLYAVPAFQNPDMAALSQTALEKYGGADLIKAIGADRSGLTFDLMQQYGKQFSDGKTRYFLGIPTDHSSVLYWGFGTWLNGWGVKMWDDAQ